jgi:hypothetical protein
LRDVALAVTGTRHRPGPEPRRRHVITPPRTGRHRGPHPPTRRLSQGRRPQLNRRRDPVRRSNDYTRDSRIRSHCRPTPPLSLSGFRNVRHDRDLGGVAGRPGVLGALGRPHPRLRTVFRRGRTWHRTTRHAGRPAEPGNDVLTGPDESHPIGHHGPAINTRAKPSVSSC